MTAPTVRNRVAVGLAAVLTAVVYALVFCDTLSPLYHGQPMNDSGMFLLAGRWWSEGLLPYRDFFDTKGPLVYALNALGYGLTGSRLGVGLLEVVAVAASLLLAHRIFRQTFSALTSLLLMVLTALSLALCTQGGNEAALWVLPFLMADVGLALSALRRHRLMPRASLWLGLTLGVAFMTRPTNALGAFGLWLALVAIDAVRWRHARRLAAHVGLLLLGTAVVVAPFMVYFSLKGCLHDMLYATVTYNLSYVRRSDFVGVDGAEVLRWLRSYIPCYLLFFQALADLLRRAPRRRYGPAPVVWLMATAPLLAWFVMGQRYPHYGIVAVAFVPVVALRWRQHRRWLAVLALVVTLLAAQRVVSLSRYARRPNATNEAYGRLLAQVPVAEKAFVVGYNVTSDFYYYHHLRPLYRNFCMQEMAPQMNPAYRQALRKEFATCKARYVVVDGHDTAVHDILVSHYRPVDKDGDLCVTLWKRK